MTFIKFENFQISQFSLNRTVSFVSWSESLNIPKMDAPNDAPLPIRGLAFAIIVSPFIYFPILWSRGFRSPPKTGQSYLTKITWSKVFKLHVPRGLPNRFKWRIKLIPAIHLSICEELVWFMVIILVIVIFVILLRKYFKHQTTSDRVGRSKQRSDVPKNNIIGMLSYFKCNPFHSKMSDTTQQPRRQNSKKDFSAQFSYSDPHSSNSKMSDTYQESRPKRSKSTKGKPSTTVHRRSGKSRGKQVSSRGRSASRRTTGRRRSGSKKKWCRKASHHRRHPWGTCPTCGHMMKHPPLH